MKRIELPEKTEKLSPYLPGNGKEKIRLDANESFCSFSGELRKTIADEIMNFDYTRYPDPEAKELCAAFAKLYGIDAKKVVAGNGSDELISVCMTGLLKKGDKVLLFDPDFSMYRFYAEMAEAECVVLCEEKQSFPDLLKARKLIEKENISLVIFSNPCNPTGLGIDREKLCAFLERTSAIVILDEAYMDFWEESLLPDLDQYSNLIILRTCSKALGMAALRVGFAVANDRLRDAIYKVKSPYNVNGLSQKIASIVLSDDQFLTDCRLKLIEGRNDLYQELKELEERFPDQMEVWPTKTNFVYLKAKKADKMAKALSEQSIAIRNFGKGNLRITTGSLCQNKKVIKILKEVLDS